MPSGQPFAAGQSLLAPPMLTPAASCNLAPRTSLHHSSENQRLYKEQPPTQYTVQCTTSLPVQAVPTCTSTTGLWPDTCQVCQPGKKIRKGRWEPDGFVMRKTQGARRCAWRDPRIAYRSHRSYAAHTHKPTHDRPALAGDRDKGQREGRCCPHAASFLRTGRHAMAWHGMGRDRTSRSATTPSLAAAPGHVWLLCTSASMWRLPR